MMILDSSSETVRKPSTKCHKLEACLSHGVLTPNRKVTKLPEVTSTTGRAGMVELPALGRPFSELTKKDNSVTHGEPHLRDTTVTGNLPSQEVSYLRNYCLIKDNNFFSLRVLYLYISGLFELNFVFSMRL